MHATPSGLHSSVIPPAMDGQQADVKRTAQGPVQTTTSNFARCPHVPQ
jgi:hypothetical protein